MIRVILWDVDGTLLNFNEAQKNAIRSCFAKFNMGECTDEMLADYDNINKKHWKMLERGEITKQQVLEGRFLEFFGKYGLSCDVIPDFNEEYQVRLGDTICFYSGVLDTLLQLKAFGVIQIAVTNGTKKAQDIKLEKSQMNQIFNGVFISEAVGYEKPDKRFFDIVLDAVYEKLPNVKKSEIMIVGDSLTSDMPGGINAGIKTCWFRHHGHENTAGLPVDYTIENIPDVMDIFRNSFRNA